jgi:hypothetical protein
MFTLLIETYVIVGLLLVAAVWVTGSLDKELSLYDKFVASVVIAAAWPFLLIEVYRERSSKGKGE